MFEIKTTINGKPMTEANITNELENMMFEATIDAIKEAAVSVLSEEELSSITIDVTGDLGNPAIEIVGPSEVVEKINNALGE